MNQILILKNLNFVASSRVRIRICANMVGLVFIAINSIAIAQNDFSSGSFVPPPNAAANDQWAATVAQPNNSNFAFTDSASNPSNSSFPQQPVAFSPGIRTAKLDLPTTPPQLSTDKTVDSTIESTTAMLSNLKDATSEKLTGLMDTFKKEGSWSDKLSTLTGSADISRMIGSLALVLGLYFAFVWVMRKIFPQSDKRVPPEVIDVIGQVPFGPKRNLQLVRLGSKLLLLMNSPEGTQPIGEITDPTEVEYLSSLCPGNKKRESRSPANQLAALQQAAQNIAMVQQPATPSPASAIVANQSNLAGILRNLERSANPSARANGSMFEA